MRFDVAIVGGGVIGWSIAARLLSARPGLGVCVVERNPSMAMGSTGRAAGGIRAQFGTPVNVELSLRSIREFERMQVAADIGLRQHGYLFVAPTPSAEAYLESVGTMQRDLGVPVERLSKAQVAAKAPYLFFEDILSGAFSPTDGYLDPYAVCQAFERLAREGRAKPLYSTEITGAAGGRLETTAGEIGAEVTVIASGHWSKNVGSMFGLDLPVESEKHQLAMTDSAPGLPEKLPMVVDLATSFHFRREGNGLLIGYNDPAGDAHDESDAFEYGFLERMAEVGMHRLPLLEHVGFDTKKCWAGFYAETPDGHAIIDRVGDVVVCTGFGGHGIMHSPAAGVAAAELALSGECASFDLRPLRLSRFAEGDLTQEAMVI